MATRDLDVRVEHIEETLQTLNTMPARMGGVETRLGQVETRLGHVETRIVTVETRVGSLEEQFVQFRAEVKQEFSATRAELRTEIAAVGDQVRAELHRDIDALRVGPGRLATWSEMKSLHEELVQRIALLGEGRAGKSTEPAIPRRTRKKADR